MGDEGFGEDGNMLVEPQMRSDRAYLDLGCGLTQLLTEDRIYKRQNDWRDRNFLEPNEAYKRFVLPPSEYLDQPETGLASRYCHTSINKLKFPLFAVKWSPDARRLITADQNGEFTLWSSFGFIADSSIGGQGVVRTLTWSKSGEYLLSGDMDGTVKYWNPQFRLQKEISQAHDGSVRGLSFSPTDLKFVSASDDVKAKIWDFETGNAEVELTGHGFDIKCCHWHPFKSLIATGSRDNTVKLWDPRTARELRSILGHKNTVSVVTFNPHNGNWFATASRDKLVRIFDLRMMKKEDPCLYVMQGHPTEVYSAAWHPQHENLLASGGYDGSLCFWLAGGSEKEAPVQAFVPAAHEGSIWTMDWSPAGNLLCTGSQDRTCKFWSRMRPGMNDLSIYKGYQRCVDEVDVLREMHQAPPPLPDYQTFEQQKESLEEAERDTRELESGKDPQKLPVSHIINIGKRFFSRTFSNRQIERDLATNDIPCLDGNIGTDLAHKQAGMNLLDPKIFHTYNDGKNYNPEPPPIKFADTMKSGILSKQVHQAGMDIAEDVTATMGPVRVGANQTNDDSGQQQQQQIQTDPTRLPGPRLTGFIKKFDAGKGYGFVRPHDPALPDLFFQKQDIEPAYGKNGEQTFERMDLCVFKVEEGFNRQTNQPQMKAKHIVHGDFDPERIARQKDEYQKRKRDEQMHQNNPYPPSKRQYGDHHQQPQQHHHQRQHRRPQVDPAVLLSELAQATPAQHDDILRYYGVSRAQVQEMIQEQQRAHR